jgi:hypothetical protein
MPSPRLVVGALGVELKRVEGVDELGADPDEVPSSNVDRVELVERGGVELVKVAVPLGAVHESTLCS